MADGVAGSILQPGKYENAHVINLYILNATRGLTISTTGNVQIDGITVMEVKFNGNIMTATWAGSGYAGIQTTDMAAKWYALEGTIHDVTLRKA